MHSFKLASETGQEKPLAQRVVPRNLNLENQKMGRKKIQISKINDERNRQVHNKSHYYTFEAEIL